MWIRSQNRKFLIDAKRIVIIVIAEDRVEIRGDEYILGAYKTYERAIEVLNDIQESIATLEHNKMYKFIYEEMYNQENYVYEMPKE